MTIDWWSVLTNGLWLTTLGLLLAAVSMAYFQAGTEEVSVRSVLARPPYNAVLAIGGALFFVGLAAVDDRLWVTALFTVLAGLIIALFLYSRRQSSTD